MTGTAIVLLAAGGSTRMRGADKLLEEIGGIPLLTRSARTSLASDAAETLVVLGANRSSREAALANLPVRIVANPDWRGGMGTSLAAGIAALPPEIGSAIVMLSDMPDIPVPLLNRLMAREGDETIRQPMTEGGTPGNPVFFDRAHFPALAALAGDEGAKTVIAAHRDARRLVPANGAVLTDLDTPEAWAAWRAANAD